MCCTISTAACWPVGSARHHLGERARAAGGGGDRRALPRPARQREQRLHVGAARRAAPAPACGGSPALRTVRSTPSSRSPNRAIACSAPVLLLGHQVHRAQLERADRRRGAGPGVRAHHHDRPRRLRHDVADGAEAVELRHLQVHQDQIGRLVVHLLQRVHAVPGGARRPGTRRLPSTTSLSSRRKKGLSSTTRTVRGSEGLDTMRHRGDLDPAVRHPEPHRPAVVAAGRLADERPRPCWCSACRQATTFRSPIWIVPGAASPANMLAPPTRRAVHPPRARALLPHQLEQARHGGLRKLGRIGVLPAQRRRGQQHVRQPADPRRADRAAGWRRSSRGPTVTSTSSPVPARRSATRTMISPAHAGRR